MSSNFLISNGDTRFQFMNTGDIRHVEHTDIMINQVVSNEIDGSMNNIYLRIKDEENGYKVSALLGVSSSSKISKNDKQVRYSGDFEGVKYCVTFTLQNEFTWFWTVDLEGTGQTIDLIYGQDIGIAHSAALQSNEAYVSQYVDHKVFDTKEQGFVVTSRQNQAHGVKHPYIQIGSMQKMIGFETDGFNFFGKTFKETNEPEALIKEKLSSILFQYEFNYIALQSETVDLNDKETFIFYNRFSDDHPLAISSLEYTEDIKSAYDMMNNDLDFKELSTVKRNKLWGANLNGEDLSQEDLDRLYPIRLHEEFIDGKLVSFFTQTREHVVLKAKEIMVERPHGHIIMSGNQVTIDKPNVSSTNYMYGIFNSQIVIGNTNMNKFISNQRNHLNLMKSHGQRIYVKIDGAYKILAIPSIFEVGFNYAKWEYVTAFETFIITSFASHKNTALKLEMETKSGKAYDFLITNQIVMNETEYKTGYKMVQNNQLLTFSSVENSMPYNGDKELIYHMKLSGATMHLSDESLFIDNGSIGSSSMIFMEVSKTANFNLDIEAGLYNETFKDLELNFENERESYREHLASIMNNFALHQETGTNKDLEKMNTTIWWYTHNMFIHYLAPHGLEQYGGAAWGARDVAQGPLEYFLAMQHYDIAKNIIKQIFSHQILQDGSWPQWFMFDTYHSIFAEESHGDIIVWPLKAISDYLNITNDFSILEEKVPYMDRETGTYTKETYSISKHLSKEIKYIKDNFLHDTYLSKYGDGDWDDTLQPANEELASSMASSWTVALTYQTLKSYGEAIMMYDKNKAKEVLELSENVRSDFEKYIMNEDVLPGFVHMPDLETVDYIIHPKDTKTGVKYRLLPMIRSIISELLNAEDAEKHYDVIKRKLSYADGTRLMDRPANYTGGVSVHFKRAEQAANYGREIGLLYVHAQIRFVEAMAKLGKQDEAWNGLNVINPIQIMDNVKTAKIRQSNSYFSSSDADFLNRYDAQENYGKLRSGEVKSKGGWRIYSSGPGIYINQLISNVIGIRLEKENLIIDPVMPEELGNFNFNFTYLGYDMMFKFTTNNEVKKYILNGDKIVSSRLENRYRETGDTICKETLMNHLKEDSINILEIKI